MGLMNVPSLVLVLIRMTGGGIVVPAVGSGEENLKTRGEKPQNATHLRGLHLRGLSGTQ